MSSERKIVFIGGVHGVGKGTFCAKITSELEVEHIVASELIKWAEITKDPIRKNISNVNITQDKLIIALDSKCEETKTYLLDGHFCLINNKNQPIEIPLNTFKSINPILMLLLTDSPEVIKERLEKRDGIKYEINTIEKLQNFEICYAKLISKELNCELLIFTVNEYKNVIEKLNQTL
ncbi:ATP-binding protein [uncultured Draconibacterium sp.]|jgi:adenylate kinase|uniref:ATP-binding protein n=1 Tax=uncultured Draconibacterium sp. TaxID=1573823 RepID=UPI0029C76E0B|nr:ATP-binding protein [uncultured Draconibacterium sp.]